MKGEWRQARPGLIQPGHWSYNRGLSGWLCPSVPQCCSVMLTDEDRWGGAAVLQCCSAGEFYSDLSNNCLYTEWSQPPLHPSSHQPVILHQHHPPTQWQYRYLMIPGKLSMYFFWQSSPPRWDLTIFVMFVLFPGMFSLQLPSLTAEQWSLIWILYWYSTNRRTMVQQQQRVFRLQNARST